MQGCRQELQLLTTTAGRFPKTLQVKIRVLTDLSLKGRKVSCE